MTPVANPQTVTRKTRKKAAPLAPDQSESLRPVVRVYAALARHFAATAPPCENLEQPVESKAAFPPAVGKWLELMDQRVKAHQLRVLFQTSNLSTEENLRALLQRYLRKSEKTDALRDKVDFLLVQYLFCCAPEGFAEGEVSLSAVAKLLRPVLGPVQIDPGAWLGPLGDVLEEIEGCETLGSLIRQGCLDRGRQLKQSVGQRFFQSAALISFARFNFLLRRAFFRLVQAEVRAIRKGLDELEHCGVTTLDCRAAELSGQEPTSELRRICDNWRQPFRAAYSAGRPFQEITALGAAVREALRQLEANTSPSATTSSPATQAVPPANVTAPSPPQAPAFNPPPHGKQVKKEASRNPGIIVPPVSPAPPAPVVSVPSAQEMAPAASPAGASPVAPDDLETCVEKIAQQIPGSPKGGCASVLYKGVRLLLHSWEEEAFRVNGSDSSGVLRHAVAARAILTAAVEACNRAGGPVDVEAAVVLAERWVTHLRDAAARARSAKQEEVAVSLSASSKRLLASIDKAKKLPVGNIPEGRRP